MTAPPVAAGAEAEGVFIQDFHDKSRNIQASSSSCDFGFLSIRIYPLSLCEECFQGLNKTLQISTIRGQRGQKPQG